jgi:hypothetical protein
MACLPGKAEASTIPLVDLPPGVKVISTGIDPQMFHVSGDYGWGTNFGTIIVGGMASYDISGKRGQRESQTMVAFRATRQLGGTFPFSIGATLSAGMNLVDPTLETPPDQQIYTSTYLFWFQPAINVSTTVLPDTFNDNLWFRATFGPVLNRWTSGTYFLPFFSPNMELAYRIHPAHEIVLGGGFWPWGIGWRGAF